MEVPAGLSIKALENTDKVFHLVIPAKPTDLSDEDLDKVAGGEMCPSNCNCHGGMCACGGSVLGGCYLCNNPKLG